MLEVYTHETLNSKPGAITSDEHGGSARLAVLGEQVLESAVMSNLFRRRPMHSAHDLKEMTAEYVSKNAVDRWTSGYKLRDKIRYAPGAVHKINRRFRPSKAS